MKFLNSLPVFCCVLLFMPTLLQANGEIVSLPTFKTMAESELRAETGVIPYQQDENIRKALQHRIVQLQDDAQSFVVDPTITQSTFDTVTSIKPSIEMMDLFESKVEKIMVTV